MTMTAASPYGRPAGRKAHAHIKACLQRVLRQPDFTSGGRSVTTKPGEAGELRNHRLLGGERLLFRTANSAPCWQAGNFVDDFAYLTERPCMHVAQAGVQTVGVDYLSVGEYPR